MESFAKTGKLKKVSYVVGSAITLLLSGLGIFKELPESKATIMAVKHFQTLPPNRLRVTEYDMSNTVTQDSSVSCVGILRFDLMNFGDQNFQTKTVDISGIDAKIVDIYTSGDTSNPPQSILRKRIAEKLRNRDAKVEGVEIDEDHGEFEIKGINLSRQDGLHLDLYLDKHSCPPGEGVDAHNDAIGVMNIQSVTDSDKINFVTLTVSELMRDRYFIESNRRLVVLILSAMGLLLTVSGFFYVFYSKNYLDKAS